MKKILYFLLTSIGITSILSCEKDFKITAPYKETTVIYSLLNPNDSALNDSFVIVLTKQFVKSNCLP